MTKVSELTAGQGKVEIEGVVTSLKNERTFNKFGKDGKVRNAVLKDDSGDIEISLWNEQVDQVGVGDKIKISNGWVSEYQGKKQLSTGKFGKLEVLSKGAGESKPSPFNEKPVAPPKPKLDVEDVVEEPRPQKKVDKFDYGVTDDPEGLEGDGDDVQIDEEDFD